MVQALKPADFADQEHRDVFRAIAECASEGRVTSVMVMRQLERKGRKGVNLAEYVEAACLPDEVDAIVALLREHGYRRRVYELGAKLQKLAQEAVDGDALQQQVAEAMREATSALAESESPVVSVGDALTDVVLEATTPEARRQRLAFGFARTLGHHLGGLASGLVYVLAARTSVGKSALAIQMATEACRIGGARSVLYVTLEMPPDQLARRILLQETGVHPRELMDGAIMRELNDDLARIRAYPIRFNLRSGLTAAQVVTLAKWVQLRYGLDLLVVDYLQRLRLVGHHDSLARAIGEQVAQLQDAARELEVPVVLVSQLNRDLERRDNKRPTLADLRDSGNIEEFADVVLLIYRHEYHHRLPADDPRKGMADVTIAKNRVGPHGAVVVLRWDKRRVRFDEPTDAEVEAYLEAFRREGKRAA